MDTAHLFQSGRSQAVRLPKDYQFSGSEVAVNHFGNGVLLLPIDDPWQTLEEGLATFEPGFLLDTKMAAHALSQQATLITNNPAEFSRAPGRQVQNWVPQNDHQIQQD